MAQRRKSGDRTEPGIAHCRVFCRTRFGFETAEHSAINREAVGSNPYPGSQSPFSQRFERRKDIRLLAEASSVQIQNREPNVGRSKSVIYAASCFGSLRFLFSPHATTICSSQLRSARLPRGWHPRVVGAAGMKRNRNAGQIGHVAAKVLAPDGIVGIVFL